jgi:hypothetical protein
MARTRSLAPSRTSALSVLNRYSGSSVSTFSHARHALDEALRRSGIRPGANVLIPGFICRDVLSSLHSVGAQPVFYAVDTELRPINLFDHSRAHAILAVNYFGIPQEMEPFLELRDREGTIVIEDNAHGLLGRDPNGRLLGTRGDFGLLSMRKTFHLPDGAALLDNRPSAPTGSQECVPGHRASLRRRVARVDRATGLPLMSGARSIVRLARRTMGRSPLPSSGVDDETRLPDEPRISCAALRVLERIDPEREVRRRRNLLAEVGSVIDSLGIESLSHRFGTLSAPYGVPFRASAVDAAKIRRLVRRYHVTVMPWPDLPHAIAHDAPEHYRDLWLANFI